MDININPIIRIVFGLILVGLIWHRVDWSVGVFALLVLIRCEIADYLSYKQLNK